MPRILVAFIFGSNFYSDLLRHFALGRVRRVTQADLLGCVGFDSAWNYRAILSESRVSSDSNGYAPGVIHHRQALRRDLLRGPWEHNVA